MAVYQVRVLVSLKAEVMDVQGTALLEAVHHLEFDAVKSVRVGRYFELEVEAQDEAGAKALAGQLADRLLANTVIESFEVEVGAPAGRAR